MPAFAPRFTITNAITAGLTAIERVRGFLEAATLSDEWVARMSQQALLLEAHHTTHIEGTQLTLARARGRAVTELRHDLRQTRDTTRDIDGRARGNRAFQKSPATQTALDSRKPAILK
jgi:hypothetical protein